MSEAIDQKVARLMVLVNQQADDEALWCDARTIFESMLQEALRRLHAAIESTPQPDPYITELIDRLRDKTDIIPDMTVRQANAHLVCLCNDAADALEAAHGIKEQSHDQ